MTETRRDGTLLVLAAGLVLSLLLHAAAYAGLAAVDAVRLAFEPRGSEVEVLIEDTEPEPETEPPDPPEPEPDAPQAREPRDRPEPEPEREPPREPASPEPEPEPEPEPAPAEETPVRFDGEMLSSEDGDWNVAPSSGQDRDGALAAPGRDTGRRRDGRSAGTPGGRSESPVAGPRVVQLGDLSGRPVPPNDTAKYLEELYPSRARQQGVEAVSKVRVRINADGSLGPVHVEAESVSGYGFGDACKQALRRAGDWSPPRDRSGRAVATWITYKCSFVVR